MTSRHDASIRIEQGHCYLTDFNPPRRSKPGKIRPALVIEATDVIEAGTPGIVVVPITSVLAEGNILRVRLNPSPQLRLKKPSDALLDQIHTIDRSLILEPLGFVSPEDWQSIKNGVAFLLSGCV